MAKKSFRKNAQQSLGGLGAIIQNTVPQSPPVVAPVPEKTAPPRREVPTPATEPKAVNKPPVKRTPKPSPVKEPVSSQYGCKPGDTRKTFIVKIELAEKMQDIAYWEPGKLKDHMNAALEAYVKKKWTRKRPKEA